MGQGLQVTGGSWERGRVGPLMRLPFHGPPAQGLGCWVPRWARAHTSPHMGATSGLSWRAPSTPQSKLAEAWVPTGGAGGL